MRMYKRGQKWYIEVGRAKKIAAFESKPHTAALMASIGDVVASKKAGMTPPPTAMSHINRMDATYRSYLIDRLVKFGLMDATHQGTMRPILGLVDQWITAKRQAEKSAKHIKRLNEQVTAIIDGIGADQAADITANKVTEYLHYRRTTAPAKKKKQRQWETISAQTYNHYRSSLHNFFDWLMQNGICSQNPAKSIPPLIAATDPKRPRRVLSQTDLTKFLTYVRASERRCVITGERRYWLYRLACETGLRANECRQLRISDIDWVHNTVTVSASEAKNSKTVMLPIKPDTAKGLKKLCGRKKPGSRVWPEIIDHLSEWMQSDCTKAGIKYETTEGVFDFHAWRHTHLTRLGRSGLPLKDIMFLGRLSSAQLASRYMHSDTEAGRKAIEAMPDL